MGRKPNPLILAHFTRGAKLNDSSNRYEHTCKACGEIFPKGRIDSLTNHLVKKCPNISIQDRRKALLELNNLPYSAEGVRDVIGEAQMHDASAAGADNQRSWTALETLAEVSRQIDMNDKQPGDATTGDVRASEQPRQGRLELQEQYTLDNPPVSYEQNVQRGKKSLNSKQSLQGRASSLPASNGNQQTTVSRSTSPNLAMAASSIAAAAAARFIPPMVDPALFADDSSRADQQEATHMGQELHAAMFENNFNNDPEPAQWDMLGNAGAIFQEQSVDHTMGNDNSPVNSYQALAITTPMTTAFTAEYGNGQKSEKPKSRARFSAERRKYVQEVRKLGACIRCRILRKTCSKGTPCEQCKKVDNARVWKHQCSRTKIAEEFHMFTTALHATLANHKIAEIKQSVELGGGGPMRSARYQIEASHYPSTTIFATFNALDGQVGSMEGNIDPGLGSNFNTLNFRILDQDGDDLPLKLEAYVKRISHVFVEREPSHFMHTTLNAAVSAARDKPDSILTRVLELWSMVHILADSELKWVLTEKIDTDGVAGQGPAIEDSITENPYAVMSLQLGAAAEKKASIMCKQMLSELERNCFDREKPGNPSHFELYITTLIVLNCIEKMTWLFRCWEQESFRPRWPLVYPPAHFAGEGDLVSGHFHYVLRIRNFLPKIYVNPDGKIAAEDTEKDQSAKDYFKNINLSYDEIEQKQMKPQFDATNSRCYELRYCALLLLPMSRPQTSP
ncbi:hypothetical protein B0O99DRAFT_87967 [Bisporella sp. PMI_857]|nr:hypothetical protein B0O99DRAFT_87967 [Bisporella sp. PMI_857]